MTATGKQLHLLVLPGRCGHMMNGFRFGDPLATKPCVQTQSSLSVQRDTRGERAPIKRTTESLQFRNCLSSILLNIFFSLFVLCLSSRSSPKKNNTNADPLPFRHEKKMFPFFFHRLRSDRNYISALSGCMRHKS